MSESTFKPLKSQPNIPKTWLLRGAFGAVSFAILFGLGAIPYLFYAEYYISQSVMVLLYILLLGGVFAGVRYLQRKSRKTVIEIMVDHEGVHYIHANREVSSIRYKDLEYSPFPSGGDLGLHTPYPYKTNTRLMGYIKGREKPILFDRIDLALANYPRNVKELEAHFLRGVDTFRPDLEIPDYVYSGLFIDPKDFSFDRKSYIKTWIIVGMIIVVILVLIELYMYYRFGGGIFKGLY